MAVSVVVLVALMGLVLRGSRATDMSRGRAMSTSGAGSTSKVRIHGNIKLSGQKYRAVCSCADRTKAYDGNCTLPSRLRIHTEETHSDSAMTSDDLHALLGGPAQFAPNLFHAEHSNFMDIDHRVSKLCLATLGGELGEFLHGLNAFETLTESRLTETDVALYFKRWLGWAERGIHNMTFLTDGKAIDHLESYLVVPGVEEAIEDLNLRSPQQAYRDQILKDLTKYHNHGSKFIRSVLRHPEKYYLSKDLAGNLVKAFFNVLWDSSQKDASNLPLNSRMTIQILEDFHAHPATAWVNFKAGEGCTVSKRYPAFKPSSSQRKSIFIHQPGAARVLRKKIAKFFALQEIDDSASEIFQLMDRRASLALDVFAKSVSSIPFYTVVVE